MAARAAITVIAVVLTLAGCAREAASYDTGAALAEALAAADVPCTAPRSAGSSEIVSDHVTCGSTQGDLELYVFDTTEDRDAWLLVGARLGPVASGPNWTVGGVESDVKAAATALNARIEHEIGQSE